jgi:hypothetical protein
MRKIYGEILVFFKAMIIPIASLSFSRAGLSVSLDAPRTPLAVNPVVTMERIVTPGAEFDASYINSAEKIKGKARRPANPTRTPISALVTLQSLWDPLPIGQQKNSLVLPRPRSEIGINDGT